MASATARRRIGVPHTLLASAGTLAMRADAVARAAARTSSAGGGALLLVLAVPFS